MINSVVFNSIRSEYLKYTSGKNDSTFRIPAVLSERSSTKAVNNTARPNHSINRKEKINVSSEHRNSVGKGFFIVFPDGHSISSVNMKDYKSNPVEFKVHNTYHTGSIYEVGRLVDLTL